MSSPSSSSVAPTGENPPLKKKKKVSLLLPRTTISSLPDDLVLSCLARVSRLYYPTLSLVCKKFRLLLASPELYEARSVLGRTEICIYVSLRFDRDSDPDPRWFILCRKPKRILANDTTGKKKTKKKMSFGYVLASISVPRSFPLHWACVVAVGSNIYAIHRPENIYAPSSSSVSILDCRSNTWHEAPSMRVERKSAVASALDGKIYVVEGKCKDNDYSNWMEVFDPNTQTWETVLCPVVVRCMSNICASAAIEEEIVMFGGQRGFPKGLAYKPKEDRWEELGMSSILDRWVRDAYCVIDNVLYSYRYPDGIKYYDSNKLYWVGLIGLESLPKIPMYSCVKLVCYGKKMVVLWDKNIPSSSGCQKKKKLWCAVIALVRQRSYEKKIVGNVEWVDDDVLTVPSSYEVVCALTATV